MTEKPTSNWTDRIIRGRDFVAMAQGVTAARRAPAPTPSMSPIPAALSMPMPARPTPRPAPTPAPSRPQPPAEPPRSSPVAEAPRAAPRPVLEDRPTQASVPSAAPVKPAYARAKTSSGTGRRNIAIAAGLTAVVLGAGGWFLFGRDGEAPAPADPATVVPRADEALVGMPVSETGAPLASDLSAAPTLATPAPSTTAPQAPADSQTAPATTRQAETSRPVERPAAETPAPPPPDIQVQGPPQIVIQPQPQPTPPAARQDWDPFLRGDAPISTAEPPLTQPQSTNER